MKKQNRIEFVKTSKIYLIYIVTAFFLLGIAFKLGTEKFFLEFVFGLSAFSSSFIALERFSFFLTSPKVIAGNSRVFFKFWRVIVGFTFKFLLPLFFLSLGLKNAGSVPAVLLGLVSGLIIASFSLWYYQKKYLKTAL